MDEVNPFRIATGRPMGPLTGLRPENDTWGGSVPPIMVDAILHDTVEDLQMVLEKRPDFPTGSLLEMAMMLAVLRAAQRFSVELDGCTIDARADL